MKRILLLSVIIAMFAACNSGTNNSKKSEDKKSVAITAAGATFPLPFYNMIFKKYSSESGTLVTYGGIGSGGGIRSLKDKLVDFGATDAFLSESKMKDLPAEIVHIPTCLGAVVIAYNLPGYDGIKLTPDLLAGIFMGEITKWNDAKIQSNNKDLIMPNKQITVVYRSDGSGTTNIFSDYMSKISTKWASEIGVGKSLNWKTGIGAKGNPGVAGTIQATEGSVGYVGSEYAFEQNIQTALLKNAAGNYIKPSIQSISASAQGELPANTCIMLTNSTAVDAYPISGFTWLILYKEQNYNNRSFAQAEATLKLLDWVVSNEAQSSASKVNYAPLPEKAVKQAKEILRSVTYNGELIFK